ncbi:hypothetical protein KQJ29_18530, partial [Enterococcus sp. S181_ASV_20]|nr:hypothetical protein [Enterococcus sp. S181_ASV_20]
QLRRQRQMCIRDRYGPSPMVSEIQAQFEEDVRRSERLSNKSQKKRRAMTIVKERLSEFFTPLL